MEGEVEVYEGERGEVLNGGEFREKDGNGVVLRGGRVGK